MNSLCFRNFGGAGKIFGKLKQTRVGFCTGHVFSYSVRHNFLSTTIHMTTVGLNHEIFLGFVLTVVETKN